MISFNRLKGWTSHRGGKLLLGKTVDETKCLVATDQE